MKKIFILEDQTKGLELIQAIIHNVFGTDVIIQHKTTIQSVCESDIMNFDIALIDLSLPDGFSFDIIRRCKTQNPIASTIVTTLYSDDDNVFNALESGADGYLLKSDGIEKLTQCLQRILEGEPPMSPQIARKLMRQFSEPPLTSSDKQRPLLQEEQHHEFYNNDLAKLSDRESDVLALIAKGMMTKEIALHLDLSIHTINDFIKAIYKKLNINSRAQAAAVALQSGLGLDEK